MPWSPAKAESVPCQTRARASGSEGTESISDGHEGVISELRGRETGRGPQPVNNGQSLRFRLCPDVTFDYTCSRNWQETKGLEILSLQRSPIAKAMLGRPCRAYDCATLGAIAKSRPSSGRRQVWTSQRPSRTTYSLMPPRTWPWGTVQRRKVTHGVSLTGMSGLIRGADSCRKSSWFLPTRIW